MSYFYLAYYALPPCVMYSILYKKYILCIAGLQNSNVFSGRYRQKRKKVKLSNDEQGNYSQSTISQCIHKEFIEISLIFTIIQKY